MDIVVSLMMKCTFKSHPVSVQHDEDTFNALSARSAVTHVKLMESLLTTDIDRDADLM